MCTLHESRESHFSVVNQASSAELMFDADHYVAVESDITLPAQACPMYIL